MSAKRGSVFISHGRNNDWMRIQLYIEKDLLVDTIELAQVANLGRTVLTKLEELSASCDYAVIVMTGDDTLADGSARARENVMHEIGYFQEKYGHNKVCIVHEDKLVYRAIWVT